MRTKADIRAMWPQGPGMLAASRKSPGGESEEVPKSVAMGAKETPSQINAQGITGRCGQWRQGMGLGEATGEGEGREASSRRGPWALRWMLRMGGGPAAQPLLLVTPTP